MAKGRRAAAKPKHSEAESYQHPESKLPMRPEVGTQPQFKKKKPPERYRYDSSLAPSLEWDGQNAAREEGEALIAEIERLAASLATRLGGRQMVLGYHCIFGMYGFWLPNDPRGSGSDYIAVWELFRYGAATKVQSRRSVAHAPHDWAARQAAKGALRHPPVEITGRQAVAVVQGFEAACLESGYRIHACALLPNHVHLVIGRHPRNIRQVVGHLKARGTQPLERQGLWPDDDRPVWGEHGWNVFLDDVPSLERAISYTESNPAKEGKRRQRWHMVVPFDLQGALQTPRLPLRPRSIGGAARRGVEDARRK